VPNSTDVSWGLRTVAFLIFGIGGCALILTSLLGASSFWYIPCFYALPLIGLLWLWRPSMAANLSVGPLVGVGASIWYFSGFWLVATATCLIGAIALLVLTVKRTHFSLTTALASVAFLLVAFTTDRAFTNRTSVRSYTLEVALNGNAPWGAVGPEWSDGTPPLVLYRRVGSGYCFIAFQSNELRNRLAAKGKSPVVVELNITKDFGHERSYNVRSVDGLLLQDDKHLVRDYERFGGQILGEPGETSEECW
jgi:hypothetical protein